MKKRNNKFQQGDLVRVKKSYKREGCLLNIHSSGGNTYDCGEVITGLKAGNWPEEALEMILRGPLHTDRLLGNDVEELSKRLEKAIAGLNLLADVYRDEKILKLVYELERPLE